MTETAAIGAAIAAGLSFGLWRNFEEMQGINHSGGSVFQPHLTRDQSAERFANWDRAVQMVRTWSAYKNNPAQPPRQVEEKEEESNSNANSSRQTEDIIGSNTHEVGLAGDFDDDDEGSNDEDDLMLEIRRIEMMQKLKKLKKNKAAYM